MRVLHIIRGLANSSGTTHIVDPLAEAQARSGAEVAVFFVDKPPFPAVVPDAALVESCCFPQSIPLSNPGVSWAFARALGRRIGEFDVVHIHAVWNFPTWWGMRAAARAGVPFMVAPQGSFEPWAMQQNPMGKRLYGGLTELPLFQRAAAMQALSEAEVAQCRAMGIRAPAVIIPNGIAAGRFDRSPSTPLPSLAERLDLPAGSRTLLFLSRVHPKKGLDRLLEGFAAVIAERPEVYLVVAGDDAGTGYRARMMQLATDLGLGDRCRFLGEVEGALKDEILLGADAFVLPSHSEGLPVAAIEAMGAGLPVILTPGCNLREVGDLDAGLIVEPEPQAIATAILELFANPERAQHRGAQARRLANERFTWDRIAEQTLGIYESFGSTASGGALSAVDA